MRRTAPDRARPLLLGACATATAQTAAFPVAEAARPRRSASPGVVSAADPRAAEAGAAMLRQGGSAADAAIATMLALTVVGAAELGHRRRRVLPPFSRRWHDRDARRPRDRACRGDAPNGSWARTVSRSPSWRRCFRASAWACPATVRLARRGAPSVTASSPGRICSSLAIALARDGFVISERLHEFLERARNRAGADAEGQGLFTTR